MGCHHTLISCTDASSSHQQLSQAGNGMPWPPAVPRQEQSQLWLPTPRSPGSPGAQERLARLQQVPCAGRGQPSPPHRQHCWGLANLTQEQKWGGTEGKNLSENALRVAQNRNQGKSWSLTWRPILTQPGPLSLEWMELCRGH